MPNALSSKQSREQLAVVRQPQHIRERPNVHELIGVHCEGKCVEPWLVRELISIQIIPETRILSTEAILHQLAGMTCGHA